MPSSLEIYDRDTESCAVVHRTDRLIEAPNWTRDGRCLIVNRDGLIERIRLDDPDGSEVISTGFATRCNNDHGISPDGAALAISDSTETGDSCIYLVPAGGGTPRRVTAMVPSWWHGWSPDGRTLAYTAKRDGRFYICTADTGSGAETLLTGGDGAHYDGPDYTPDGTGIWFNSDRSGSMQLWRMGSDGSDLRQMTADDRVNWFPHPSPDGAAIVYLSYQNGTEGHPRNRDVELRMIDNDGQNCRTLVCLFGGQGTINVPSWSPDGRRFAFVRYTRSSQERPEPQ